MPKTTTAAKNSPKQTQESRLLGKISTTSDMQMTSF